MPSATTIRQHARLALRIKIGLTPSSPQPRQPAAFSGHLEHSARIGTGTRAPLPCPGTSSQGCRKARFASDCTPLRMDPACADTRVSSSDISIKTVRRIEGTACLSCRYPFGIRDATPCRRTFSAPMPRQRLPPERWRGYCPCGACPRRGSKGRPYWTLREHSAKHPVSVHLPSRLSWAIGPEGYALTNSSDVCVDAGRDAKPSALSARIGCLTGDVLDFDVGDQGLSSARTQLPISLCNSDGTGVLALRAGAPVRTWTACLRRRIAAALHNACDGGA